MNAALSLRGLERRFGPVRAVDGISMEVRPGEIVGFLGANGAGKTTTLRCLSGLLRPDRGEIVIAGHDLARAPLAARRAMGFVPDRPFLYERLTPREFLGFIATLYSLEPARASADAEALLARLELDAFADVTLEALSSGNRQKTAIAAALLHAPALLLLDEPMNALDPPAVHALKALLRERAQAGAGVLVSTHQLDVAERFVDRLVLLHAGRVIADGAFAELRQGHDDATLEALFLRLTRKGPAA